MSGATTYLEPNLWVRTYRSGRALCMCGCGQPAPIMQVNSAPQGMVKGKPYRFIQHHSGLHRRPELDDARFWAKVEGGGPGEPDECWNWIGALRSPGYACFWDGERTQGGHRWAYQRFVGPIPEGYTIDHLCRNMVCVNPAHMEPVPIGVNTSRSNNVSARNARKTHCKRGHEFTPENTFLTAKGGRGCRECRNMRQREGYARRGRPLAPGTVSIAGAAKILGVSRQTVYLWVQAGHIQPVETDHRFMRFDPTTLERPEAVKVYNRKTEGAQDA